MWTRQHKQRNTGRLIVPAVSAVVPRLFRLPRLSRRIRHLVQVPATRREAAELQARLDTIEAERVEMERRVQLLHDGTLEKDMLDEQARRALNLSQADEIVIMRVQSAAN